MEFGRFPSPGETMPSFQDIPKFVDSLSSEDLTVEWGALKMTLEQFSKEQEVHLDPDFQRGHVWTQLQKQRYIEYCLRNGKCANRIIFACEGWNSSGSNPWYLVDGLQRITAVQEFLEDKVEAFGFKFSEYTGTLRIHQRFDVKIVDTDRKGMLQLYLDLNAGGTPHAEREIERVRKLLEESS